MATPLTFVPIINPGFPAPLARRSRSIKDPFSGGVVKSRTQWQRTLRRWPLTWEFANRELVDQIVDLFDRHRGPSDAFIFPLFDPALYHPRSGFAPAVGVVAGGALLARTYRIAFAWGNTNGETQISPIISLAIGAGFLLTVTVPEFPTDATFAAVYATESASPASLERQNTTIAGSAGTFTEAVGGLDTGTSSPNTSNLMKGEPFAAFASDALDPEETSAGVFFVEIELEERIIA